ncbi:hypothetical protein DIPPA_30593 [Diplonema papillatum]|nr:hypothetical protein DIPPA_30593 [Diplonema papillatum]
MTLPALEGSSLKPASCWSPTASKENPTAQRMRATASRAFKSLGPSGWCIAPANGEDASHTRQPCTTNTAGLRMNRHRRRRPLSSPSAGRPLRWPARRPSRMPHTAASPRAKVLLESMAWHLKLYAAAATNVSGIFPLSSVPLFSVF